MAVAKQEAPCKPQAHQAQQYQAQQISITSSSSQFSMMMQQPIEHPPQQQQQQQQQHQQQQHHNHLQLNCSAGIDHHRQAGMNNRCAGCSKLIKDRFIFSVIEQNFHQDCVRCADCSLSLNERCYTSEGKLYCRSDYWRRYGPKCSACQEPIKPTELVQRLRENLVYHLDCFVCQDCKRHLQAGEQLHLIDEKRLMCKSDYMAAYGPPVGLALTSGGAAPMAAESANSAMDSPASANRIGSVLVGNQENLELVDELGTSGAMLAGDEVDDADELDDGQSSTADGDSLQNAQLTSGGANGPNFQRSGKQQAINGDQDGKANSASTDCAADDLVDANGKRRGPRTTIKPKQLETLRRAFESAPKPSRHIREQLAAETGLNMRVIQVWFQNRRSKERRMKNSNGSARRNFFRTSSRRIRVVPAAGPPTSGTPTPNGQSGGPGSQQSLIAGSRQGGAAGRKQASGGQQSQQQMSPMDSGELMMAASQQQHQSRQQHNSPSDFGGSSSGGFTYFSDSSNQGDAFAMNSQQQQPYGGNQSAPSDGAQAPPASNNLLALESPSGVQQVNQQSAAANRQQQQQYGHQPMKNTPPPQLYQPGMVMLGVPPGQPGPPHPLAHQQHQHQQHPHPHPHAHPHAHPHPQHQQHQHQMLGGHLHHAAHLGPPPASAMLPAGSAMSIGGLLGPQGPSPVVQW